MSTMTLERLLHNEQDNELLGIYNELYTCVVPATGNAHAYCRKVNKMIDAGNLCIREDTYRKIYLPTLAKAVLKEMANRYASHCYNTKASSDYIVLDVKDAENLASIVGECLTACGARSTSLFGAKALSYERLVSKLDTLRGDEHAG